MKITAKHKQAEKYRKESGAGFARQERVRLMREEAEKLDESQPLTAFQHQEMMRAEAEASRLEILRLRTEHEAHSRMCRNAP